MPASEPAIEKIVCRQCYAVLDAADNYCRHCGMPTPNLVAAADAGATAVLVEARLVSERCAKPSRGMDSPWIVLPMLFLVLGPLGLPMLWRSRQFSVLWKMILTVLVLAITAVVLWAIWLLYQKALAPLQELRGLPGF